MNINRFANEPDENMFHSSGYAETAHGANIGATSRQTFNQRVRIEKNRQAISRYRDSMIAREHARLNRHRLAADSGGSSTPNTRQGMNAGAQNASPSPDAPKPSGNRQAFREPPSRGYNPYG